MIEVGDWIQSWSRFTRRFTQHRVGKLVRSLRNDLVEISVPGTTVVVSSNHRFLNSDRQWVYAAEFITSSIKVVTAHPTTGVSHRTVAACAKTLEEPVEVFNLELEGGESYLVGDCCLVVEADYQYLDDPDAMSSDQPGAVTVV